MAEKYISKVRISGENFVIRDKDSYKLAQDAKTAIEQITGSDPGQLANIRDRIQKIEQELDNPGAAKTLVTILDTLDGFDKNKKGDVKTYVNTAVAGAKAYADTKKSEAIDAAASDATSKANTALSNAKE